MPQGGVETSTFSTPRDEKPEEEKERRKKRESHMTPKAVEGFLALAGEHGWSSEKKRRGTGWVVVLWQERADGTRTRFHYEIGFRNIRGWRPVWAFEQIQWREGFVTQRDVELKEVKAVVRGL